MAGPPVKQAERRQHNHDSDQPHSPAAAAMCRRRGGRSDDDGVGRRLREACRVRGRICGDGDVACLLVHLTMMPLTSIRQVAETGVFTPHYDLNVPTSGNVARISNAIAHAMLGTPVGSCHLILVDLP